MKILMIILVLVLLPILAIQATPVSFSFEAGGYNDVPQPRLRYPIYDSVILTKGQPLEFQWWNDVRQTRGFIFKIYKGYNMYAANLVRKNELSADVSSIKIDSGLFVEGQVYTWSLIRVSFNGYKSDKSFNSFKVIKK
jgi:hypothetical protein